ncbi:hypothetical protein [Amycolatopsis alkalitolerans]|uniref:Uncharacterized protein n=1 Tax=Amycolatopsis alkalitolerans TaxID=2547244 RepID=A0A5C4LS34_9PSEU|nr:hypothetical protein [Amycolatopsis alkalitolerans]TNC20594.1 hypothetical protein FG385_30735 [Amycolatopsis alkalitolerans]
MSNPAAGIGKDEFVTRYAVDWMAQVPVVFRIVTFDGNAVRGFTFAPISSLGVAGETGLSREK